MLTPVEMDEISRLRRQLPRADGMVTYGGVRSQRRPNTNLNLIWVEVEVCGKFE